MKAWCWEHELESPVALPLYLEAGFILCLNSWLVWYHRLVVLVHSIAHITCPLDSFLKLPICPRHHRKPRCGGDGLRELFCQYVDVTSSHDALKAASEKGMIPIKSRETSYGYGRVQYFSGQIWFLPSSEQIGCSVCGHSIWQRDRPVKVLAPKEPNGIKDTQHCYCHGLICQLVPVRLGVFTWWGQTKVMGNVLCRWALMTGWWEHFMAPLFDHVLLCHCGCDLSSSVEFLFRPH